MFAALAAIATAVGGYFLTKGEGGGILGIPEHIDVDVSVDFWEKNKTLFILLFVIMAAFIVVKL